MNYNPSEIFEPLPPLNGDGHVIRDIDPPRTSGPVLTCMADVQPCDVAWLWHGRVPLGRITLLVGRPGEGKSYATMDMAARVSTGTPWPDGESCEHGSVLIVSAEDDPGDTIRPRLDAHYADVSRVHLLSAVRRVDSQTGHDEHRRRRQGMSRSGRR